jgi:hypothetical protein
MCFIANENGLIIVNQNRCEFFHSPFLFIGLLLIKSGLNLCYVDLYQSSNVVQIAR